MNAAPLLAAAFALAPLARAAELEDLGAIKDPDMVSAMEESEEANVENALQSGRKKALKSAENLRALAFSALLEASAALDAVRPALGEEEEPPADSAESEGEDLKLSQQLLNERIQKFPALAKQAELGLEEAPQEKLLARRRGHRAAERERDLKSALKLLSQAKRRFKIKTLALEKEGAAVLESADQLLAESRSIERRSASLQKKLALRRGDLDAGTASRRLEARIEQLRKDVRELAVERELLETYLLMARLDEVAFDAGK